MTTPWIPLLAGTMGGAGLATVVFSSNPEYLAQVQTAFSTNGMKNLRDTGKWKDFVEGMVSTKDSVESTLTEAAASGAEALPATELPTESVPTQAPGMILAAPKAAPKAAAEHDIAQGTDAAGAGAAASPSAGFAVYTGRTVLLAGMAAAGYGVYAYCTDARVRAQAQQAAAEVREVLAQSYTDLAVGAKALARWAEAELREVSVRLQPVITSAGAFCSDVLALVLVFPSAVHRLFVPPPLSAPKRAAGGSAPSAPPMDVASGAVAGQVAEPEASSDAEAAQNPLKRDEESGALLEDDGAGLDESTHGMDPTQTSDVRSHEDIVKQLEAELAEAKALHEQSKAQDNQE